MSKIAHLPFRKTYLEFMRADTLLDMLVNEKIVASVEDVSHLVVARYGTNKTRLKKLLND